MRSTNIHGAPTMCRTVLGAGETEEDNTGKVPVLKELTLNGGRGSDDKLNER